jgi:hypothetical protein
MLRRHLRSRSDRAGCVSHTRHTCLAPGHGGAAAAPEVDVRVAWLRGRHDGTELWHGGELRASVPRGARAGGQVDPLARGLRRAQQPPLDLWHREQLRRPERDGHEATDVANAAAGRLRRGLERKIEKKYSASDRDPRRSTLYFKKLMHSIFQYKIPKILMDHPDFAKRSP